MRRRYNIAHRILNEENVVRCQKDCEMLRIIIRPCQKKRKIPILLMFRTGPVLSDQGLEQRRRRQQRVAWGWHRLCLQDINDNRSTGRSPRPKHAPARFVLFGRDELQQVFFLAFGLPFKFLDATLGGGIMLVVSIPSKENMGAGLDSCKPASVSRAPYCPVFFAFWSGWSRKKTLQPQPS